MGLSANEIADKIADQYLTYFQDANDLRLVVSKLLDRKMTLPEIGQIPKIDKLNQYIEENLVHLKKTIDDLPASDDQGFERLNRVFMEALELV